MTKADQDARRGKELAAIHVLSAKRIGLDRETYEALLQRVAGVRSAADLDARGRSRVLDELRQLAGEKRVAPYPGRPHNADSDAMPAMIEKIEALLTDCGLAWAYADAIVRRMYGIERVAWCREPSQLRAVVAALHVEQEKRALNEAIDKLIGALGLSVADVDMLVKPLRPNWRRHRPSLRLVRDYLAEKAEKAEGAA